MNKILILVIILASIIGMLTSFSRNEPTGKAELGRLLFFDTILSKDKTISCASCHQPEHAFADTSAVSKGVGGVQGTRNTPSAMNLSLQRIFFWDGRAKSLEEQALAPIENPLEMNLPIHQALSRLKESERYNRYFKEVFIRFIQKFLRCYHAVSSVTCLKFSFCS